MKESYIEGQITTEAGSVLVVSAFISLSDKLGALKVMWAIGRSQYRVEPGIYAAGSPDKDSPVMVSANYKLSFDMLRKSLAGIDA
ncbi:MAG: hypothetical protein COZ15_00185 [Elusimicrobia bacterium CG_4_10_14_3_um_filter_49_12_50_7]|nr:MAG: hypothetical protein COZ72_02715 [Elusimicrobia bacterium CG_4_8_14_3_um_filter_50_9]PIY18448.1 MAG: hypothetical protein COZ15_00185 [Elusimicrobia bacterium CG_4_10_14_3_um_filter_49_12_50_7]